MRYKLIFGDAHWQSSGRRFVSLTSINDDGSSNILHVVLGEQITFGSYSSKKVKKKLEFSFEQTYRYSPSVGETYAKEEDFSRFLGQDILKVLLLDKVFLAHLETEARRNNHRHTIEAVLDLKKGICHEEVMGNQFTYNFRLYVMNRYFKYFLSCNNLKINASPAGDFIEIQANSSPYLANQFLTSVTNFPIDFVAAQTILAWVRPFVKDTYPGYPTIHQILFLNQPVTGTLMQIKGHYEEITEPTQSQIEMVNSVFDYAHAQGFFSINPQTYIRDRWTEHCRLIADAMPQLANSPFSLFQPARRDSVVQEKEVDNTEKKAL